MGRGGQVKAPTQIRRPGRPRGLPARALDLREQLVARKHRPDLEASEIEPRRWPQLHGNRGARARLAATVGAWLTWAADLGGDVRVDGDVALLIP